jgi:hypothetical protein
MIRSREMIYALPTRLGFIGEMVLKNTPNAGPHLICYLGLFLDVVSKLLSQRGMIWVLLTEHHNHQITSHCNK